MKAEQEIKRFFDFVFSDDCDVDFVSDIYVNNNDSISGIYDVCFKNPLAYREAVQNASRLKKILNLYLDFKNINYEKFKLNFKRG